MKCCKLTCQVIPMGKDYTVTVCGGSLPHVGSVVMAQARLSLTGSGTSATSSVLNCVGHKDETIARMFAEKIHLDDITEDQLAGIQESCNCLLDRVLADMK